ncbi:LLM class flavin-dependent oxidoreductase [Nocardia thailandica]|uniref:LLM class flavin-dependent oxidoreductase n=1 Tax=Nocardia thailandica TaxID=257275 RepID=A0ABW6PIQ6_9NOCA
MSNAEPFLGIELPGTGTHPASWRRADSGAEDLFTAGYWTAAVTAAESFGLDAVFVPDSFAVQPGGAGVTRGRLDAVAVAARTAAATSRVALVPQVPVTHTEAFHVSKAIAALDFATLGRAGWEVTVSEGAAQAKAFGRKDAQDATSLWAEAEEAIEVAARLWDSWEDDAEIRDVPTGRFIDRAKLHYIDFLGEHFSVKGPSITPRSPQGQPIVVVRADDPAAAEVAARRADLVRISAPDLPAAAERRRALRAAISAAGRDPDAVRVLLDLELHLADSADRALADLDELDRWAGAAHARPGREVHLLDPAQLDTLLDRIAESGAADGAVLRPLAVRASLAALEAGGRPRTRPGAVPGTFRDRLGLPRPASRYALPAGAAQ